MSRHKRRSDNLAPALFPFLAVLLCTIGALILILAITVTNSHASVRKDAEMALLQAKDERNLAQAFSEELESQREQYKSKLESSRRELTEIEDHIERLSSELENLQTTLHSIESKVSTNDIDKKDSQDKADELKREIDTKRQQLAEEIERQKRKKPAFAIVPYSGKSGTNRRPIYIECTKDRIVIQPEGISIHPQELIPPGPGNPLASALRTLRKAYGEMDSQLGIRQPPYPLLLVRPDGIESYAYAREAMADWDDQFGYELIAQDMELAFPPSVPGIKSSLEQTIAIAKDRQAALLAANPKLRRELEKADDRWEPTTANNSSVANDFGKGKLISQTDGKENWKMVRPYGNVNVGTESGTSETETGTTSLAPANATGAAGLPPALPTPAGSYGQSLAAVRGNGGGGDLTPNGQKLDSSNRGMESANIQPQANGETRTEGLDSSAGNTSANGQASSSKGNAGNPSGSAAGTNASASNTAGSSPSASSTTASSSSDPNDPQSTSVSITTGGLDKSKYVKPEGDLRPISVGAGANWAQAKARGKASPVSRTIQIVALRDKWFIRDEAHPEKFDVIIAHNEDPQAASEELATAIRKRVDSWGLSLPGGYWVPQVIVEAASDADRSVSRLERLLEGSGVDLQVVPLKIPGKK